MITVRTCHKGEVPAVLDVWAAARSAHAATPDALVREGERRLRGRGATGVTALVAHDDPAAQAIWRAAGYAFDAAIGRLVRNLDA